MLSLLAAILIFGLIVLIHEFGHFLLAKKGGVCVVEFSLGMGPRLISFIKGGTRYSLKAFPFGGSCMMLGEDEDLSEEGREEQAEREIAKKAQILGAEEETDRGDGKRPITVSGRAAVSGRSSVSGRAAVSGRSSVSGQASVSGRASVFGQAAGDGGEAAALPKTYAGIELPPGATGVPFNHTGVWTRFLIIAAGPFFNFILAFICSFFIISYVGYDPAQISRVSEGYPAAEAGLQAGDVITGLNGKSIKIFRDIQVFNTFHQGETVTVEYERDGERHEAVLTPEYSPETQSYVMGISGGINKKAESLLVTARYSAYEVRYWINLTFKSLGMIVRRQVSADDIAGPVRIVSMIDETVKESSPYGVMVVLLSLANLCILLSANLGIMNLLPIPALDGGRLVFILLEAVRGKPIDREKEGMIHMAGMAVLMVLMVFILFNDIRNLL